MLWCDIKFVVCVFLLARYRRFRQSAFDNCGALLTTTGMNDDHVVIEGAHNFRPLAPGTILYDAGLENDSWSGAPEFTFSNELPGGNDQAGPDSPSENHPRLRAMATTAPAIRRWLRQPCESVGNIFLHGKPFVWIVAPCCSRSGV